jgi:hypothetical protein
MDWLRSEDLKEEKNVTTPWHHYSSIKRTQLDLNWPVIGSLLWHDGDCGQRRNAVGKKKTKKPSAKETLAAVIKEMAKPRVAMSARE